MAESSGCCREYKCKRRKPFLIRRGGLTDRIYLITDYDVQTPDRIYAKTKHDVTEAVEAFMCSEGWAS